MGQIGDSVSSSKQLVLRIGTIFGLVSSGWLFLAPALGHMGRPWPCVVLGAIILAGTAMSFRRPDQRIAWAVVVIFASVFALLLGQGAVIPGLIGALGGALMITAATRTGV